MICDSCGEKSGSWQEYCRRCGGELVKKRRRTTEEHSMFFRFFYPDRHQTNRNF